jgi:tetratricopeptide (TPR) repeat protein
MRYLIFVAFFAVSVLTPSRAEACGWSYESYHEEAVALPCVYAVLLGSFPQHTNEYFEAQIKAADAALLLSPYWLEGLQLKGLALMKLSKLKEAEEVFLQHLKIDPDGYASHANLGTLYTFTGDYEKALSHIDKAMEIEPNAHFGREKYHRMLVVYLKDIKDPAAHTKNFLGFSITEKQRLSGSSSALASVYKDNNIGDDAFDALSSMITVYGAKDMAELYLAFGDLLALSGKRRFAWTAYKRAEELKHPRTKELKKWQMQILLKMEAEYKPSEEGPRGGGYVNIANTYAKEAFQAKASVEKYKTWEQKSLSEGLSVWSDEGFTALYKEQLKRFKKCKTPGLLLDAQATNPTEAK